jgi:hypothetical protein
MDMAHQLVGLLGVARGNTSVGVRPVSFLLLLLLLLLLLRALFLLTFLRH